MRTTVAAFAIALVLLCSAVQASASGCCVCDTPSCTDDIADMSTCVTTTCSGQVAEAFNTGLTCVLGCGDAWDTPTPTATVPTATATIPTATVTDTPTVTETPTVTGTATVPTETPTVTATGTITETPTETATATVPTNTPTQTATNTVPTSTPTVTATNTIPTSTATPTATPTDTPTPTHTPTRTHTPTVTYTSGPVGRGGRAPASLVTRVQNVTAATVVRWGPTTLHRIVVANNNAAVQTLTVLDGAATIGVYQVPTKTTLYLEFEAAISTGLVVTPSSADLDVTVIYD